MINEGLVEQQALTWFQETGWSYLPGSKLTPDAAPAERADGRVAVLSGGLAAAVRRLNPQLPDEAVEEVVRRAEMGGGVSVFPMIAKKREIQDVETACRGSMESGPDASVA